ncbi:hypothetical protein BS78_02G077400 [Paspalum vaginatum]|nr:hypothetical protein BS78_02G077400 [Paspalum vaginatum]
MLNPDPKQRASACLQVITEHLSVEEAADKNPSTATCASLDQKLCPFQELLKRGDTQGAKGAAVAPLPLRFQPLVHLYILAFIQPYDSISQPCCIMYMTILHVELASGWMVPWAKANSNPTVRVRPSSSPLFLAWPTSSPLTRSHVAREAPLLREHPRAPEEHLLAGRQSSPLGLVPALISTPHNTSKKQTLLHHTSRTKKMIAVSFLKLQC